LKRAIRDGFVVRSLISLAGRFTSTFDTTTQRAMSDERSAKSRSLRDSIECQRFCLLPSFLVSSSQVTVSSTRMVPAPKPSCWATLLTKCDYLQGALVLDQSLRKYNSAYPLVVYATPSLPVEAREILQARGIAVRDVDYLEPVDKLKAKLDDHDHRFADTWTKLRAFELVEFEVS
jgi:hypothetical protein